MASDHGSGAVAVEVEVADLEFLARLFQVARAARVDGSGQGVGRIVGHGDGFVEVRSPQHGQDRAEDLFPGQPVFGPDAFHHHERGIVARAFGAAFDEHMAFTTGDGRVLLDLAALGVIHHRAHEIGRVLGRSDGQAFAGLDQAGHEPVIDGVDHDHPGAGRAFLALEAEGRVHHADHGLVEVGVVVDDDGVFAAHFGHHPLAVDLAGLDGGRLVEDAQPHFHGAGKGDGGDFGMGDQVVAHDRAPARAVVEHAVGQAGFLEDGGQVEADQGGQARRLVDDAVAGGHGSGGHAAGDGQRKVPGRDHGADAARLVKELVDLAGDLAKVARCAQAHGFPGVVFQEVDGLAHIIEGLPPLLAHFQDLDGGQGHVAFAGDFRRLDQDGGAFFGRGVAPGREGGIGRGHGRIDLGRAGLADMGQHFARIGRVDRGDAVVGGDVLAADDQRHHAAGLAAHGGDGGRETLAQARHGEIGQGLVVKGRQAAVLDRFGRLVGRRRGGQFPFQGDGRVFKQAVLGLALGKALAQEGFVGRVFEQPAHEIGHARQQLAVGAVEPHPAGHLEQAFAHGFGHADQGLEFVAVFRHAEACRRLHDIGDGAHVVGGALEIDEIAVFEHHPGKTLVGDVGLGLAQPGRHGPAHLFGQHGLVVPVGALDQTQSERQARGPAPADQFGQIAFGVLEIGLEHDGEVRVVAEFRFAAQAPKQLDGDVLVAQLLHVDAKRSAHGHDLAVDRAHAFQNGRNRALEIHGIGLGVKGRGLDGGIDLGHRAPVQIARGAAEGLPAGLLLGQGLKHFQIAVAVGVALALGHGGLAEQVHGEGESVLADAGQVFDRFLGGLAHDELPGHAFDVAADGLAHELGGHAAEQAGFFRAPLEHGRDVAGFAAAEVLLDVAGQGLGCGQVGQYVHEPEQLDLEGLVLHGPVHDLAGPEPLVEDGRRLAPDAGEKRFAALANGLVESGLHHRCSSVGVATRGRAPVSLTVWSTTVELVSRTVGSRPMTLSSSARARVSGARTLMR